LKHHKKPQSQGERLWARFYQPLEEILYTGMKVVIMACVNNFDTCYKPDFVRANSYAIKGIGYCHRNLPGVPEFRVGRISSAPP
jgi:hypothetical protein